MDLKSEAHCNVSDSARRGSLITDVNRGDGFRCLGGKNSSSKPLLKLRHHHQNTLFY